MPRAIPPLPSFLRGHRPIKLNQLAAQRIGFFNNLKVPPSNIGGPPFVNEEEPVVSSLLNGISAYWSANLLDGVDVVSGNTVNPVGGNAENVAGKISNCWSPLPGGAVINRTADTININFAGSFTLSCWVFFSTAPNTNEGFFKNSVTNARGYGVNFTSAANIRFSIQSAGSSKDADLIGGITVDSAWHRYTVYHDTARQVIGIYKNNDTPVETSTAGFSYVAPLVTDDLTLAQLRNNAGTVVRIDELGMWNRVWTSAENLLHWNSGAGLAYPFN